MKWLLLLLLIPSICFGAEVASINGVADSSIASVGGVTGTGIATICGVDYDDGDASCSVSTNEVGDRTDYTATSHFLNIPQIVLVHLNMPLPDTMELHLIRLKFACLIKIPMLHLMPAIPLSGAER
jgi:hypothetical protein